MHECINTSCTPHPSPLFLKKERFLLQKLSPCSFMLKVTIKKPGNVSFRKRVSAVLGKLRPWTRSSDDPFTMPPMLTSPHQGEVEYYCTWMLLVAFSN